MNQQLFVNQFNQLPEKAQEEVLLFLASIAKKYQEETTQPKKRTGFGSLPGIQMVDDFDAPLEDFKDYLPE